MLGREKDERICHWFQLRKNVSVIYILTVNNTKENDHIDLLKENINILNMFMKNNPCLTTCFRREETGRKTRVSLRKPAREQIMFME